MASPPHRRVMRLRTHRPHRLPSDHCRRDILQTPEYPPMRRLGLTLFACLLAATGLAADPHWTQVAGKADYSMVVYLDTNSVKVREGRLTAWVQTNYVVALKTTDRVPKE